MKNDYTRQLLENFWRFDPKSLRRTTPFDVLNVKIGTTVVSCNNKKWMKK